MGYRELVKKNLFEFKLDSPLERFPSEQAILYCKKGQELGSSKMNMGKGEEIKVLF